VLAYSTSHVPTQSLSGNQSQSFRNSRPTPERPKFGYNENSNNIAVTGVYKNTFFAERNAGNLSAPSSGKIEKYPGHYRTSTEAMEEYYHKGTPRQIGHHTSSNFHDPSSNFHGNRVKEHHSHSLNVTAKPIDVQRSMNYHSINGYNATSIIQSMKGAINLKNK
jgi:hypothetical protein